MSHSPRERLVTTVLDPELESDPYLISLVRGGDVNAFGRLYERHVGAAKRLARVLARDPADADDLVAETFTKVLAAMRAGHGPDTAFRAYLLTTLRHTLYDRTRRDRRIEFTDDLTPYEHERASIPDDPLIGRLETAYAARAFARLPERWRTVLWHTEVEGETPAQIAPLLGLTPNGVAALAYRARERLRQMYLQEHIEISNSPRCHWTGLHLPGYVRAQLARRDRTKVEDHLADCAQCRRLHRELTEENAGLRSVLAGLLLGSAAPGYLTSPTVERSIGGVLAGVGAVLVMLWRQVVEWCAQLVAFVAGLGFKLYRFPRRLVERYGPGNVAAASGLVVAGLTGVAVFAGVLVKTDPPGEPGPHALPRPAPTQKAPVVVVPPSSAPSTKDPSPLPPPPPAPVQTTREQEGPGITTMGAPTIAQDPAEARLVAGEQGVLPIAVRIPESTTADDLTLRLLLPPGMSLAAPDAGDGWQCTESGEVRCARPMPGRGEGSVARLKVHVERALTGYQSIKIEAAAGDAAAETVTRVPIAPPGMRVGYAALGQLGFDVGGNALLACVPRPACLSQDSNQQDMFPVGPEGNEPPALPDDVAVSMAQLVVPQGAHVRWASLMLAASGKHAPGKAWLHGPASAAWIALSPVDGSVDVTEIVRAGGEWWVAVPAGELPNGRAMWAGWSLAVAYDDPAAGPGELAVYAGPRPVPDGEEVSLRVGEGGPVDLGLVLWDGDAGLAGDTLTVDHPVPNVGAGSIAVGVDVVRHRANANRDGMATLRTGNDPMVVGLMVLLASRG